jgi:hypothetical protein
MGPASEALGAIGESVVFLDHFNDLPDPRQRGKIIYPLAEVLLLCLLAVLCGAETFVDIARFGEKKIDLLRRFRPFRDGTPSHDHLGDIFATLDAEAFQRCFVSWVAALTGAPADVIAIDGKTLRRSYQKKGAKAPIHMVSAFAARQRLVLGQVKVADKSNETVAIRALLDTWWAQSRRPATRSATSLAGVPRRPCSARCAPARGQSASAAARPSRRAT